MLRKIFHNGIILLHLCLFFPVGVYSQAPAISYPSPKTYVINKVIQPLAPANTGGSVPAGTYGSVTRFAGQTGVQGSLTGGTSSSQFITPYTVCTNQLGNIFINDPGNRAIKVISPGGNVIFRSQGVPVNAGSPQALNNYDNPTGIAADAANNVYIADSGNNLIRKVAPDYVISVFAGNRAPVSLDGTGAAAGFNLPTEMTTDTAGNLYVVDGGFSNNKIRKITAAGVVTTLFSLTNVSKIGGIVRDKDGNFFVTRPVENTIEKISTTGTVSTFAGSGVQGSADGSSSTASFNTPGGIAIDGAGNLYTVSIADNLVRKITPAGVVSTFAGQPKAGSADGVGTNATFNMPTGIAFDSNGNGYIVDSGNYTVRKMVINGYEIDKPLPSGIVFDRTTGIISGTPTVLFPATNYIVTAHNFYGVNNTMLQIAVVPNGALTFPPISDKTSCTADFDPGATSQNSIIYSSSNNAVAAIVNNKIHIAGVGAVSITANDGTNSITRTFSVSYLAQPAVTISSSANAVCIGNSVTFTAAATNSGNNSLFNWQVNGISVNKTGNTFTAQFNNNDLVTCALTADNDCSAPVISNSIKIEVDDIPTVAFNPATISVLPGGSIKLAPVITGNVANYLWEPSYGLNNTAIANPLVSPAVATTYKLTVTSAGGCTVSSTVNVNILTRITIKNAFSPNGDGINDTWNIPDLSYFPNCTVKIYNRYGNLIFNTINYAKAWDGTFNGSNLPSGSYFYIIDPKNQTPPLSGEVMLIR